MYGQSFAEVYDEWYRDSFDTDGAVDALETLARGGPILELGVGTGRLALPLAIRGSRVVGIDASSEMLERLAATDCSGLVTAVCGDMSDVEASLRNAGLYDRFTLIFCAFNTLLNLSDQSAMTRCLTASRELLTPDGLFVVEAFVPIDSDTIPRSSLSPAIVSTDAAVFIQTSFENDSLVLNGRHIEIRPGNVTSRPWSIALYGPEHIDVAAQQAGLTLMDRWSDWTGSAFTDESSTHISIYGPTT